MCRFVCTIDNQARSHHHRDTSAYYDVRTTDAQSYYQFVADGAPSMVTLEHLHSTEAVTIRLHNCRLVIANVNVPALHLDMQGCEVFFRVGARFNVETCKMYMHSTLVYKLDYLKGAWNTIHFETYGSRVNGCDTSHETFKAERNPSGRVTFHKEYELRHEEILPLLEDEEVEVNEEELCIMCQKEFSQVQQAPCNHYVVCRGCVDEWRHSVYSLECFYCKSEVCELHV